MRGHAVVWSLTISSRSCCWSRITEQGDTWQRAGSELNTHKIGTFGTFAHFSCYLWGPLCCMFGLN